MYLGHYVKKGLKGIIIGRVKKNSKLSIEPMSSNPHFIEMHVCVNLAHTYYYIETCENHTLFINDQLSPI